MFWGYLWLVLKFSWLSILIIYLLYFVFGIIATKVNAKTQSDSSYVSLIGIKNDIIRKRTTALCDFIYSSCSR